MLAHHELQKLVDDWVSMDPNPVTCLEIQNLWEQCQYEELDKRLSRRIEFGTAGLRGKMEGGWNRMNDLIVIQTSQGLAEYVLEIVDRARDRGVVIGHDHRHNSAEWAHLTAKVFISKGIKIYMLNGFNHTPLVPFGIKELHAACGVMITASHNPKDDNGYKVYWENAIQIIAPHDSGISDAIHFHLKPVSFVSQMQNSELFFDVTKELHKKYFDYLISFCPPRIISQPITFVNTSLHGVSDVFVKHAFEILGFPLFVPVSDQQHPHPDFPTVSFPNPEEKGALDLALTTANTVGAKYILAQDPDADRFAAAEKSHTGEWIKFTGDQLGAIFASKILYDYRVSGQSMEKLAMVASTVSSKMLKRMAQIEGFKFVECLTGFKFIGNTALQLSSQGYNVPFAYEEAIGYMFGSQIRDKDGVAATALFVDLVYSLQAQNKTVHEYLTDLYNKYGFFKTQNGYFFCENSDIIYEIFTTLRNYSGPRMYPKKLGGLDIYHIIDLTIGYDSGNPPDYIPLLPMSAGQMLQIKAQNPGNNVSLVLTLRTSGTEPKIKFYLEGNGADSFQVESDIQLAITDIINNWMQAIKYGLYIVV